MSLPQAPTAVAKELAKFKPKNVFHEEKEDGKRNSKIPSLTLLSLDVVAKNFARRPDLEGLDPKFVNAITSKLSTDLDFTTAALYVADEEYWKRKALEQKKWTNCQISDHGLSWKQLFFEKNLAEELEQFGVYEGMTRKHEDEMLRPAIDSTHPRWSFLYPKADKTLPNGKPNKERFCALGTDCRAVEIMNSPNGLWPFLDLLKARTPGFIEEYTDQYAHATVEEEEPAPVAEGGIEEGLDAKPQEVKEEDPDKDCDHNVLREYLTPAEVDEFNLTGEWPKKRRLCILCMCFRDLEDLTRHIMASEDYVFTLYLERLLSHIDMELVFRHLPNLTSLHLTYSVKKIGMKYDRSLFGMKISDAMSLAKCIKATDTLTSLALPCNMVDDDLLRLLMTGLIHNQTITSLDLSHNKITNHGVRLLSKLLGPQSVIMTLDISDNQIFPDGGKYLGRALKKNESLVELNLRLNRLEDEGGRLLFEGLKENRSLTSLNIGANLLQAQAAKALGAVLANPQCPILHADLSSNRLTEEDAQVLASSLRDNVTLTSLDLRGNPDLSQECRAVAEILGVTRRNELELRKRGP